ncbi:glycosyltransferase family 4 protein [Emcibacter sp. SYSU 3D8]|uniref:glycosyltransferase family 4 protein n=1 Tax=Emcibacter sp. SYSU 3D8 TaxID=3133969 RepID=UPI0031FEAC84
MHIRFLTGRLDSATGEDAYDGRLIDALAARGHRISVIARTDQGRDGPVTVYPLPLPAPAQGLLLRKFELPLSLARGRRAIRNLSCPAPDITVASEHLFMRGHAARFRRRPWVYFPHPFTYPEEIERFTEPKLHHRLSMGAARRLQSWAVGRADITVRLCRTSMEAIMEQLSLDDMARFTLITPATWTEAAPRQRDPLGPLRLLVTAEGLHTTKRLDLAIRAVLALPPWAKWELHIVGDGDDRTIYETQAADDGRILPIHFHGAQDDLSPFYRRCDVLLFPSRLEHMGLTLIDAMKHGLPVLALDSRIQGLHTASNEIVDNGETGWLAGSDEAFVAGVQRLVTDPAPVDAAGARAHLVASKRFAWESHVDRWEEVLTDIVARSG